MIGSGLPRCPPVAGVVAVASLPSLEMDTSTAKTIRLGGENHWLSG